MSQWMNRLDLKDLWKKHRNDEITIEEIGKEIAKRIRKLKCYKTQEETLEEIALNFENISDNDVEEFDGILSDLYDWADTPLDNKFGGKKMCWIATVI